MSTIHESATVTISYTGKLDNGDIFKTVPEEQPLTVTLGNHELPPTLEKALIGVSEGDNISVRVTPEEGYGARQKMLVQTIDRKSLGGKIAPRPGMILSLKVEKDGEEHQVPATVMEVSDNSIVIDYNHPLAGHHLTYHVHVISVEKS